jgi:hypothetical protein
VPAWHVLTGVEIYDGPDGRPRTRLFAGFADLAIPGVIDRKARGVHAGDTSIRRGPSIRATG